MSRSWRKTAMKPILCLFRSAGAGSPKRLVWIEPIKSMGGLTANGRNRDMRHRRIRLRAVPVALAGFDVHDVADGYLALFLLRRDHAPPGCNHQNLIAVVGMPSGSGAFAEVHHVEAKVVGLSVADDRLPRPADRSPFPSGNGCRAVHGVFR